MVLSPQSQLLYKTLLSSENPLSAKQLASKLGIFPATLYRLTEPLLKMGLILKTPSYPYLFSAKPADEGLSLFLLSQTDWFSHNFRETGKNTPDAKKHSNEIQMSFIQSRDELMNTAASEIENANTSVDLIRSGHELTPEVMLAIIKAKERGVTTRMLIQDYSKRNASHVDNWQKNGILVRKISTHNIRLMIYDSSVVYFMSYKHSDSKKDLGMKIAYPPLAVIFSQLFETWWAKAMII